MSIKLTKSQRLDKKNLELATGKKLTARDYLINIGKLKKATDDHGWEYSRDTGSILQNNAYQNDAFSTGSTVNAFATVRALNGQRNYRNQLAKGRYNIKRKTRTYTGEDVTTINIYNGVNL